MYRRSLLAAILLLSALGATARVISYAPYTDRTAIPAFQNRLNRHFALIETASPVPGASPVAYLSVGQLVVYDSTGVDEPRVVFPPDGTNADVNVAAAREDGGGLALIVQSSFDGGMNPSKKQAWFLSLDGGSTWKKTALPDDALTLYNSTTPFYSDADIGGPFVRAAGSGARAATHDMPFIVTTTHGLYAVARDGSARNLVSGTDVLIIGDNVTHDRFLVSFKASVLSVVDLAGNTADIGPSSDRPRNGWIAGDGGAYLESGYTVTDHWLRRFVNGVVTTIVPPSTGTRGFVAVPTADYNGIWMIERATGSPTKLESYTPQSGIVTLWSDITGPEVEALLPGASGKTVLIQVHRVRNTTGFIDPALAVWHINDPAPTRYDELYMNEQATKGFVHVDPDAIENGTPFVFDSGTVFFGCPVCSPPPPTIVSPPVSGGSDVVQEWGVVRGSLAQRLVLPGISRTQGAFGSYWLSDVTFYNPLDEPQHATVRYVRTGDAVQTADVNERSITLGPREIRLIPDALLSLFGLERGGGAFFITPDPGGAINVTTRTYSQAAKGTYGFGMNGLDVYSAVGPRFELTFSGAFFGANTRTNLILTDVSGRGASASLQAASANGFVTSAPSDLAVAPASGQQQVNGIAARVGMQPADAGGLVVQPLTGELIASVFAIDNRTNDPTYFPPDIPATVNRTIPAIGHVDGANNAKFRSDLYLINPAASPSIVNLQINPWDGTPAAYLSLTLLPHESRLIRDVLTTAFSRTGFARLRYQSFGSTGASAGVRVTSRTYSLNDDGGTYGFLMPPLNSFQSATAGDTLEILGASTDSSVRTNVGLVDLNATATSRQLHATVAFYDKSGAKVDELTVTLPSASGMQLNDIFRARGIASSVGPVLIKVTAVDGLIGAYASVVDNGTNDSTYLPANLAAK